MISKFEQEFGKTVIKKGFATIEQVKYIISLLEDENCNYSIDEFFVAKGIMTLKQVNEIRGILEKKNIVEKRIIPVKSRVSKIYKNSIEQKKKYRKQILNFLLTGLFFFFLSFLSYKFILDFIKNKKTEDMTFYLTTKEESLKIESTEKRINLFTKVKQKYPNSKAEKLAEDEIKNILNEQNILNQELLNEIKFFIKNRNFDKLFNIIHLCNLSKKEDFKKILEEIIQIEKNNLSYYKEINNSNDENITKIRIALLESIKQNK